MAISSQPMTVNQLIEALSGMDGAMELPVKIASYDGPGMEIYSVRKHVVTDEEDTVTDAFVVING